MNNLSSYPLVSVIVNCHNGQAFLRDCINSIINQTYKNWELIFWDNCSSDKSKEILESYSEKRIKYFRAEKFTTLYEARNLALKKASGDYISFLDTDDWWSANKIEKQLDLFNTNRKLDVVYTSFYIYRQRKKTKKKISNKNLPSGKITQNLLNSYNIGGILTALIKKKVFDQNSFDNRYEIIGDFDFFVNISIKNIFGCVQEPLAFWRIHESNTHLKKIGLQIDESENWFKNNINLEKFRGYKFDGFVKVIQVLKIKKNLLDGKKILALKEIMKAPFSLRKYKFLICFFVPIKVLDSLIN